MTTDDLESLLALDASYARRFDCEPVVDAGSVSFYSRTGHSFVARQDGEEVGFLIAQAVWDGRRPTVMVRRVVGRPGAAAALLEAVTKSAYDSGVYDLLVEQPEADSSATGVLEEKSFRPRAVRLFTRVLGSRSVSS